MTITTMFSKIRTSVIAALAVLAVPAATFAQYTYVGTSASRGNQTLATLIVKIIAYLNMFLVLLMGVAVVMFVYYIFKYFIKADEEHKEAGPYLMYSLAGFFIILSFWGLVNILENTFGLRNSDNQQSLSQLSNLFPQ